MIIKMMNIAKYLLYFNTALKANQFLIEKISKKDTLTRSFYEKDLIEDIIEENTQSAEMVNIPFMSNVQVQWSLLRRNPRKRLLLLRPAYRVSQEEEPNTKYPCVMMVVANER